MIIMTLVGGTAVLMWIGELITQRGIGNGMSILIFSSVVSRLPYAYYAVLQEKELIFFLFLVVVAWSSSCDRLRGAGPAPDPRPVRQARGG